MYPNPAENYVILERISGTQKEAVEIKVFSVDGKLLKIWEKPGANQIVLNEIQTLPAGLLILKISSGNETEIAKLSKYR